MTDLEKEYCAKALNRLLQINKAVLSLKEVGVNIETFSERLSNIIEESVAIMICDGDETKFEDNLFRIQNWISIPQLRTPSFDKTLKREIDFSTPLEYINWILLYNSNNPF